ncbi:MAG: hypothetical protein ACPGN3_17450 [Opitutales bacterium]
MFHLRNLISLFAVMVLGTLLGTTYPETSDTITVEDVTIPQGVAFDFIAAGVEGTPGQIGTREVNGVGNYSVEFEAGADSIWWAQDRIVLRPGVKVTRQNNGGFVWFAVDSDWDGINDVEEAMGVDYDNDGMPDGWEANYGIGASNGSDDNDSDGIPNIVEYHFGTDPTVSNSATSSVSVSIF